VHSQTPSVCKIQEGNKICCSSGALHSKSFMYTQLPYFILFLWGK
jgi:hypothetical protein